MYFVNTLLTKHIGKSMDFFVRQGFDKIPSTGAYAVYVTERDFGSNEAEANECVLGVLGFGLLCLGKKTRFYALATISPYFSLLSFMNCSTCAAVGIASEQLWAEIRIDAEAEPNSRQSMISLP